MEVLVRYLLYQSLALSYKSRINSRETNFETGSEQSVHMTMKPKLGTPNIFLMILNISLSGLSGPLVPSLKMEHFSHGPYLIQLSLKPC